MGIHIHIYRILYFMAISPDEALLFFGSIVVAIITSLFGGWWISAYYYDPPHNDGTTTLANQRSWRINYKFPRAFTVAITAIYIFYMIYAAYAAGFISVSKDNIQSASNITVVNYYNTDITNNSYVINQAKPESVGKCECFSIRELKEFVNRNHSVP